MSHINQVVLGGKARHVRFGMAGLYVFERELGRNMSELSTFDKVDHAPYSLLVDLVYSGLVCGAKSSKQAIDFTTYDVAEWISEPQALEQVLAVFTASFPEKKIQEPTPETGLTEA